ncbi:cysteine-rich CWC family protein [Paraglaciecola sp. 20A4]|uniref:cysteine-rich CWC family protein n=1 Tax=Paraglaciecola sp. 20A4 TaxID=2687288 RepID=UPI001409D346|nr:cysteine-rich CWC family protein [Paraglaciecola sp. 20A4]
MNIPQNDAPLCCPFCKQDNQCSAVESISSAPVVTSGSTTPDTFNNATVYQAKSKANCWCFVQKIPQGLIDLVPQANKGQQCICADCAAYFIRDPAGFSAQYGGAAC